MIDTPEFIICIALTFLVGMTTSDFAKHFIRKMLNIFDKGLRQEVKEEEKK